jgi:hypothetical protein
MAIPACTFCEQYEGTLMVTNLNDGDTHIACLHCLPSFALGLAAAFTEGITMEQAKAYAKELDTIYANDPRPAKRQARAKGKGATLAAVPDVPPDGPQGDAEARTATGATPDPQAGSVAHSGAPGAIVLDPPCPLCGGTEGTGTDTKLTCDSCGAVIATNPYPPPEGNDDRA